MKTLSLIRNLSIRNKLFISYLIFIFLFIVIAIVSILTIQRFNSELNRFTGKSDMMHKINIINGTVYKIISYTTTGFPKERVNALVAEQKKSLSALITDIEKISKGDLSSSDEREFYKTTLKNIKEYEKIVSDTFDIAVNDLTMASTYMQLAETNFDQLKNNLDTYLAKQKRDLTALYMASIILLVITTLAVIVSSVVLSFIISRSITKPLAAVTAMAEELGKSSGDLTRRIDVSSRDEIGQLSAEFNKFIENIQGLVGITRQSTFKVLNAILSVTNGNNELAAQTNDQLVAVEEATATLEELSSSIENIAQNALDQTKFITETYSSMNNLKQLVQEISHYAADALESASSSNKEAEKGNELMKSTILGMESIDNSTKKISEIVTLISYISEQVNLLALNASIEAARAGEHGRGFAVVADEIGKLADQTATSTKTINELVGNGLREVSSGRQYVDNTSQSLLIIIENVHRTNTMIQKIVNSAQMQEKFSNAIIDDSRHIMTVAEHISQSTGEQKNAMQEMVTFIQHINDLTQNVASSAEMIASHSKDIGAETKTLNKHIESLKT